MDLLKPPASIQLFLHFKSTAEFLVEKELTHDSAENLDKQIVA